MRFELQRPDGQYLITLASIPDCNDEIKATMEFVPRGRVGSTFQVDFYLMEVDDKWIPYGPTHKLVPDGPAPQMSFKELSGPLCRLAYKFLNSLSARNGAE